MIIKVAQMLQQIVKKLSDNQHKESFSHQFRSRRFRLFTSFLKNLSKPVSILDIGGTAAFWEAMGFEEQGVTITLLNLAPAAPVSPPFLSVQGDATHLLGFADQSFDIVFSNSVIEHLYTWENQQKMAKEVLRVGKHHFIQTPNYWFPVEPHWVFPFFQYLPFGVKCWLTEHYSLGHIKKAPTKMAAIEQVKEIRLLSLTEMQQLFPGSALYKEKILGFNKSITAHSFQ